MNDLLLAVVLTSAPIPAPFGSTLGAPTTGPLLGPTTAPLASPATGSSFSPQAVPQPYNQPGAPFGFPPAAPTPAPQPTPTPQSTPVPSPSEGSIRRLDEENHVRHQRMYELFRERRRRLVESEEWRFGSRAERKARLRSLEKEYRQRATWMRDDYRQKRGELEKGV